jgi:hypothetical protein
VDFETSVWPFHKGKPMVFIAQIPLKATKETEEQIDGERRLHFRVARQGRAWRGYHGLSRPDINEVVTKLPIFKYHPDPLTTRQHREVG